MLSSAFYKSKKKEFFQPALYHRVHILSGRNARNPARHTEYYQLAFHCSALHECLRPFGLGIKPHGNGLVLFNLHGKEAVKASSVDLTQCAFDPDTGMTNPTPVGLI
ncbi:hypothetical protein ABN789_004924 [Salmonella enterica]